MDKMEIAIVALVMIALKLLVEVFSDFSLAISNDTVTGSNFYVFGSLYNYCKLIFQFSILLRMGFPNHCFNIYFSFVYSPMYGSLF